MYLIKRSPYNEDYILIIVKTKDDICKVLNNHHISLFNEPPKEIEVDFDNLEVAVVEHDGCIYRYYLAEVKEA